MSIQVQLAGVEETLLIPLWARAAETGRADAIVRDEHAVELVAKIAYDFGKFAHDWASQTGIAIRTRILDDAARAFIAANPGAIVLNLAAGLDTRFYRVGEGAGCWYEVDLPNVIALRRQLLSESERNRFVAGSVLDPGWLEAIEAPPGAPVLVIVEGLLMYLTREQIAALLGTLAARFPQAEALVETLGSLATGNTWWFSAVSRTSARMKGGIDDPRMLERMVPGLKIREVWYPIAMHRERWGWTGLARHVPFIREQYKLLRLSLREETP